MPPVLSPVLVTNGGEVSSWVEQLPGKPLTFRTKGVGIPRDVELVPLGMIEGERYAVYWNLFDRKAWEDAKREGEQFAGKLVDRIVVGDTVSEGAHNLVGNELVKRPGNGKNWLATKDWLSLSMKVLIDGPMTLRFTYAKGDTGRAYGILLDEIYLQTKPTVTETADGLIAEEYSIPLAMTHGRRTAIVTFRTERWFEGKKLLSCEMHGATSRPE
jgi:hypothetical protein